MENDKRNELRGAAIRTLAIFGFVFVVIVGMFGSVALARSVPGAFSAIASAIVSLTSVFVPADEEIVISVPSLTVASGETFTLSWEHPKKSVDGSYTLRYDCAHGAYFTSPTPSGAETTVFCNTPFNFLNSENSITLTAFSSNNRFVDVTAHIDFTPNGASQPTVTGSSVLTIANSDVSGGTDTTNNTTGNTNNTATKPTAGTETTVIEPFQGPGLTPSDPNGRVDLTARVIEVGLVDKNTGVFTATSTPTRSSAVHRVAVRFAVENIGSKTSPQWNFNAVLPTYPAHIFSSPTQQALAPGDRIEFTLAFDKFVDDDQGELTINIDPARRINEPNKTNNILKYIVNTVL